MQCSHKYALVILAVILCLTSAFAASDLSSRTPTIPITFEPNLGQVATGYGFQARTPSYSVLLRPDEARFTADTRNALAISFVGADSKAKSRVGKLAKFKTNYFQADKKWTALPNFLSIGFNSVYEGIDLDYHSANGAFEFDFTILPGADASAIALKVDGARDIQIAPSGSLLLDWDGTVLQLKRPVAYQKAPSGKMEVGVDYIVQPDRSIGFRIAEYDRSLPLVIDPVVLDSSASFGAVSSAYGIAKGPSGSIYLVGDTNGGVTASTGLNSTRGAFVAKFAADGTTPEYVSVIANVSGRAVSVDSLGNAYLAGNGLQSSTTPATASYSSCSNGTNAFLGKLNPTGDQLLFAACISSAVVANTSNTMVAGGLDVAANDAGEAWLLGRSNLPDGFPTTAGAFQSSSSCTPTGFDSCGKTFVAKFDTTKSGNESVIYSTLLAGSYNHYPSKLAVDAAGNAYVVGATNSPDYPVANAFRNSCDGCVDIFNVVVSKLNSTGTALVYSTYLGRGYGKAIVLDSSANAYVAGYTQAANFPLLNAIELSFTGTSAGFLAKLTAAGDAISFSTYLNEFDRVTALALDSTGDIDLAGGTAKHAPALVQPAFGYPGTGNDFSTYAFAMRLKSDGSAVVWSTFAPKKGDVQGLQATPSRFYLAGGNSDDVFGTGQAAWLIGMHFDPASTNPVPQIAAVSPNRVLAGDPTYTSTLPLVVDGTNFVYGATVNWNGSAVSTQFVSSTRLVGSIQHSQFASAGTINVTVSNPTPGGGVSNSATVTVYPPNPAPTISGLSPSGAAPGSAGLTLTVAGTGFVDSSIVRWNLGDRPTTFVNATTLTVAIPASDLVAAGTAQVLVFNPEPGGGTSAPVTFTIANGPTLSSVAPASVLAGTKSLAITVTGTGFISSSKILVNGSEITTTYVSDTKLTGTLPDTVVASGGVLSVKVTNGAAQSSASSLQVQDYTITAQTTTATVSQGGTAKYSVTLTPVQGFSGNLTFTCSGLPSSAVCTFNPATLSLNGSSGTMEISISTSRTIAAARISSERYLAIFVFPLLGGVVVTGIRNRRAVWIGVAATVISLLMLSACGGGGKSSIQPVPGTPAGTYTVTVAATTGTLQHSTTVQLTVQ